MKVRLALSLSLLAAGTFGCVDTPPTSDELSVAESPTLRDAGRAVPSDNAARDHHASQGLDASLWRDAGVLAADGSFRAADVDAAAPIRDAATDTGAMPSCESRATADCDGGTRCPACSVLRCDELGLDECAQRPHCMMLRAREFDPARRCADHRAVPRFCVAYGADNTEILHARDEDGKYWELTGGVPPRGMTLVSASELGLGERGGIPPSWSRCQLDCSKQRLTECEQQEGCAALTGRPFDPARRCAGPLTTAACVAGGFGCPAVFSHLRAPDGRLWEFPHCAPAWQPVSLAELGVREMDSHPYDWPRCE